MLLRLATLLLAASSFVQAQIQVTSPAGGSTSANTISVALSGVSNLASIQVQVIAGGSKADGSDSTVIYTDSPTSVSSDLSVVVPVASGPAADFSNAFYLKIISTPSGGGGASTTYSQRFSITGLTGGWASPAIEAAAKTASSSVSNVPANQAGAAAAGASPAASGSNIPYSLQTGPIKYAPMQEKPGTTITQTNTAAQYPTSSWSIFTTMAPIPVQISTQTPQPTYSVSSRENPASPAAMPSNDMDKFLARWRD